MDSTLNYSGFTKMWWTYVLLLGNIKYFTQRQNTVSSMNIGKGNRFERFDITKKDMVWLPMRQLSTRNKNHKEGCKYDIKNWKQHV